MEKYPRLWVDFFSKELEKPIDINESFTVSREVDAKVNSKANTGGRIDLLLEDENTVIVIENKIKSDINKINRDHEINQDQLDRYKNYIDYLINNEPISNDEGKPKAYFFVLSPDYSNIQIDSKKGFKHIKYSKICNFLKDRIDDLGDSDFKAFYYAMRRQSFKHESLCLYDDMKNIFYRRIEEYAKEHLADQ